MNRRRNVRWLTCATAGLLLGAASGCRGLSQQGSSPAGLLLSTVPTPPAYISGGDALVRVDMPAGVRAADLTIRLNGTEVGSAFRAAPADWFGRPHNGLLGLVSGLREGDNEVVAFLHGRPAAALTITNYPVTGPIFSGPHLEPYLCLEQLAPTEGGDPRRFAIGNGEFMTRGALDEHCSLPTRVDHVYRTGGENGRFSPLADPAAVPADVATVTTASGSTIPYLVRIETGTVNRAIYQTAILVDPSGPAPDIWTRPAGWNGRLVFTFGGGCEAGFFQGTSTGGVLNDVLLSRGYAVASSTLNVNAQGGCNDPLSAETAMMVKERFAETYGPPAHTIGWGGSGGAMQQLLIASNYPGILDGILPTLTFPDAVSYLIDSSDCVLMRDFLNEAAEDDETRRVVGGWATWQTCDRSLGGRPNRVSPGDCPDLIPADARYDAAANPGGIRCSVYDGMRNVFGSRTYDEVSPAHAVLIGRSPHDNVGVQYGLEALNTGLISPAFFLDLNERVGGWNIDFEWQPERTRADPHALRIAYETGRITSGAGGLAVTPIIDERNYLDLTGDFHTSYYSFVMRSRLIRDNGHADNYVIQRRPSSLSRAVESLELMDEWLTNLALDESGQPLAQRVVSARPAALLESCWAEDGSQIVESQVFDEARLFDNRSGRCNELFPPHTGPRMVAGGPLTNDVLKCELKPLERGDYRVAFTPAEWDRLREIFPEGVCDWSRPGVGQQSSPQTWRSFGPSPVNRYPASNQRP
jgi:hypothetical protein